MFIKYNSLKPNISSWSLDKQGGVGADVLGSHNLTELRKPNKAF